MKLLTKTSVYYILFAVPVLAVCAIVCYRQVYAEVKDNIDEAMWKDMKRVELRLDRTDTLAGLLSDLDSEITVKYDTTAKVYYHPAFSDTEMYDHYEEETLPFRVLRTNHATAHHKYSITIYRTYLESDDLVNSILVTIISIFVCLLIGLFLINFFVARRLWKPFYHTLEILQEYALDKGGTIAFPATRVKEFSALRKTLEKMTKQAYHDFMNQKQFAENASHEMQTPLAVIKNKIELLIQSKTLSDSDMEIIQGIYNSANKLSQLNRALLLLSKIESNQFVEVKDINMGNLLDRGLDNFSDMIAMKNIGVEKRIEKGSFVSMNPVLADVLINNLLQNCIRHNVTGGRINVSLREKELVLSNTGHESKGDPSEMFSRFRKSDQSADSIGLGMAIIKQVCDHYGFGIKYTVDGNMHTITIHFRTIS
ncbi:MAG TPA: HAMP domain-containing sensor histidine kinase [Bacteroidia bacterium]